MPICIEINPTVSIGLALFSYALGVWLRKHIAWLDKYSVPSPVIGGILLALGFSFFQSQGTVNVTFDGSSQKLFMLVFFTTLGLGADLMRVRKGGKELLYYFLLMTLLAFLQNCLGMAMATVMGLDHRYGLLTGSVSMIGGLGTSAAFGHFFETTYAINAATTVAITSATFGMVVSLMIGAPFAQWLIDTYKIKVSAVNPSRIPVIENTDNAKKPSDGFYVKKFFNTDFLKNFMTSLIAVGICITVGSLITAAIDRYVKLPIYVGAMFVAVVGRFLLVLVTGNTKNSDGFRLQGPAFDFIAQISLVLFVTMAVNSLKLNELVHLALPMFVILIAQTVFILLFVWLCVFVAFGKNYDSAMLSAGTIGFGLGATANALANMQSLAQKYGSSPKAWLYVSIVGAILIDFANAAIITAMSLF